MICDIHKSFGDLNSIFSPLGSDEVGGIADVSLDELGGTPSRGLLDMWVVLFVDSRDGRMVDSSDRGSLTIIMARVKKREDIIVLSRGEWLHG